MGCNDGDKFDRDGRRRKDDAAASDFEDEEEDGLFERSCSSFCDKTVSRNKFSRRRSQCKRTCKNCKKDCKRDNIGITKLSGNRLRCKKECVGEGKNDDEEESPRM